MSEEQAGQLGEAPLAPDISHPGVLAQAQEQPPEEPAAKPSNEIRLGKADDLVFTVNFDENGEDAKSYEFDVMEAVIKLEAMGWNEDNLKMGPRVEMFKEAIGLPGLSPSHGLLVLMAFEDFLEETGKKPQWRRILALPTESKPPRCSGTDTESSLSAYTETSEESGQSKPSP